MDGTRVPWERVGTPNPSLNKQRSGASTAFSGSDNVFRITPTGTISQLIDASGDGTHALATPVDVATDRFGNVFVAGSGSNNVFKLSPGGAISQVLDVSGDGTSPLLSPGAVDTDHLGNLFVSGTGSNNVFQRTPNGAITQIIDVNGDGEGHLLFGPTCVATDADGSPMVAALAAPTPSPSPSLWPHRTSSPF